MEENLTRSSRNKSKKKKVGKGKKGLIVFLVILLLLGGASGFIYTQYQALFVKPVDASAVDLIGDFTFERQTTIRDAAEVLKEKGIIRESWPLKILAKQKGIDYIGKEGNYAFSKSMTLDEILTILAEGRTSYDYRMVISDGTNIDKLLLDFSANEAEIPYLDARINDVTYIQTLRQKYPFLPEEILGDGGFRHRLEGFLGNGTYYLKYEATIEELIEMALDKFQENYQLNNWETKLKQIDKSLFEVVTMASVVRGEVLSGDTENQKKVAGVFYNRLEAGMNFGSDVTVGYAINNSDINYTEDELNYDSPYNTYVYPGLPLGPINNPGDDVIEAVINYEPNEFYYFLADICDDGHGEFGAIYYSVDMAQHEAYSREYLACYRTFE